MDPKESRRYTSTNQQAAVVDRAEAERRPSLLGRLFRRSSSTDEAGVQGISSLGNMGQSFDETAVPRGSITSAVKSQFLNKEPPKDNTPEFSIFT